LLKSLWGGAKMEPRAKRGTQHHPGYGGSPKLAGARASPAIRSAGRTAAAR